ncbi:MAG TPA: hypothetical protein PKD53_24420 [Chloroflexaceae bacterium]|nr:hypothetical protein [Chloroflexaceae bacterium]
MAIKTLLSYLFVGLAALLPRAFALGRYLTDDEANFWMRRSHAWLEAIAAGDWAATAISTHPGVTTMWLGAAGLVLRETLLGWGLLGGLDFPTALAFFRLPPVLAHVGGVLLGYWMLRRLLPGPLALLAAALWALDPFFIGYSRLLHVDALAGTFATLSLLAACCAFQMAVPSLTKDQRPKTRPGVVGLWSLVFGPTPRSQALGPAWLVASGLFAGLAMLSKSPAVALAPAVALVAWLAAWGRNGTPWPRPATIGALAVWGLVAAATVFALWPALWASPLRAYAELRTGVAVEGAQPHMTGNFFLGRRDEAPGPLYYAAALPLRLTPWGLAGLLLLPLAWRRAPARGDYRPLLAALAAFALIFVVALTPFPKKFDRYLVPIAPALAILSAAGLYALPPRPPLPERERGSPRQAAPRHGAALVAVVCAAAIANAAWWHPYALLAYNQLLGGAPAGAATFRVGWSEGLEQVAAWLNAQPDITGVAVTAERTTSLNPYLRRGAQADFPVGGRLHRENGYVVVYVAQVQGGPPPPPFDRFYGETVPLHTVRLHGVDYAWIYQVPPPVAHTRPAGFGAELELLGYDQAAEARPGQPVNLRLLWEARTRPAADYWLFAHLVGPDGRRYAQVDQPYPTSQWAPGRFVAAELPFPLPADLPAGTYRLLVGLYDPATGERLALGGAPPADPTLSGPDALKLLELTVR